MKKALMMALLAGVLTCGPALAAPGEWIGGGEGGMHIPSGDYSNLAKNGWTGGVFLDYGVTDMLALGAHIDFNGTKAQDEFVGGPVTDVNFSIMNYGVHGNWFLVPAAVVRPYITGTMGAYSVTTEVKGAAPFAGKDTQTQFGFGGGVGAQYRPIGSPIGFGLEGTIHDVTDAARDVDTGAKKSATFFNVVGKVTFSFADMSQTRGGRY